MKQSLKKEKLQWRKNNLKLLLSLMDDIDVIGIKI